ncbi:uncharacterized protein LOC144151609 [Haemaphysalis longicornis]
MPKIVAVLILTLSLATVIYGKLGAPGGPLKLQSEVVDSFQIFTHFPFTVAISDSDNDTIFECVKANRTEIDEEAQTATFVWIFPETESGPRQEVPFYVKVGDTPGTLSFTVGDDPTEREGIYYYTDKDYEKCVVLDMEYHGHQCVLWMPVRYKDNAPEDCIEHFVDACGVIVAPNRRDLCDDGEGDY